MAKADHFSKDPPPGPRILISHIPLARPEASKCGPLRERGRILKGAGPGYQNLLGSETSRFLLDVIRPSVVFSGDDHDYCEHRHPQGVREITLKSFSSSTGIRRPGFQLLSLIPPSETPTSSSITHADRPCFLPDQVGVYTRVYLPVAILTVLFLFGTNIRSAWRRWNAAGHSIYGDLKARMSPHIASSDSMPQAPSLSRRKTDRPVPLTLPSRRSSQHLNAGAMTPRSAARTPGFIGMTPSNDHLSSSSFWSNNNSIKSAPVSPTGTPRMTSWSEISSQQQTRSYARDRDDPEAEADSSSVYDASPSISRRSSYIYMNGASGTGGTNQRSATAPSGHSGNSNTVHQEPNSYFLPIPGTTPTTATATTTNYGLGIATPYSQSPITQPVRRSSSNISMYNSYSNAHTPSNGNGNGSGNGNGNAPYQQPRRVTAPRLMSTADWTSAAKAKDKSVLGLLADSLPLPLSSTNGSLSMSMSGGSVSASAARKRGWFAMMKSFLGWMWRSRNGVVGKSWKESLAVAWPAAVVWVLVNALFFWS